MSIYPHRSAKGDLTGKFRVEVQIGKKRLKGLADQMCTGSPKCCGDDKCARAIEVSLKARLESGEGTRRVTKSGGPETILELLEEGMNLIWDDASEEHRTNKIREVTLFAEVTDSAYRTNGGKGRHKPLAEVSTTDIDAFVRFLKTVRRRAPATINRHVSGVFTLLRWGHKRKTR